MEEKAESIPREVTYYYLCKQFRCLPESGGLLDQDPVILEAFLYINQVEKEVDDYRQKREEQKRKMEERVRAKGR